jgi:hypothetical protein
MPGRLSRRTVVAATAAALAGCVGERGRSTPTADPDNPAIGDATQRGDLRLASPAFEDGGPIPEAYGHDARNVNPPLSIANVPSGAASLTLIVDDPDAVEPAGHVWLHWLVWNVPPSTTTIPEAWEPTEAVEGTNDFGERGYGGPAPPDGTHTYRFKLYALDSTLDLPTSANERDAGAAMRGAVLAQTQLTGTYPP